jgi:hypothetical protein
VNLLPFALIGGAANSAGAGYDTDGGHDQRGHEHPRKRSGERPYDGSGQVLAAEALYRARHEADQGARQHRGAQPVVPRRARVHPHSIARRALRG